jgi:site-specific recombinase XerD
MALQKRTNHNHENMVLYQNAPSGKDAKSRLDLFYYWLDTREARWHEVNLQDYAAYLVSDRRLIGGKPSPLSPASANAHLSTIRRQIKRIMGSPQTRRDLFSLASEKCIADGQEPTPANLAVYVDEIERGILYGIDPQNTTLKATKKQDKTDSEQTRLSFNQVNELLRAPSTAHANGLRDSAAIAMMVCTGLREQELCDLTVSDLRQTVDGVLSVLVREGKGKKQRAIPYGANEWVLHLIDTWLERVQADCGLTDDSFVFRAVKKGGKVSTEALTTRSIQRIVKRYPIMIDGKRRAVKPHDLRRTCARRWYDDGMDLLSIQANLGHANIETTKGYIGETDMSSRQPTRGYEFDLEKLTLQDKLID